MMHMRALSAQFDHLTSDGAIFVELPLRLSVQENLPTCRKTAPFAALEPDII